MVEKKIIVETGCSYFCVESSSSKVQVSLCSADERDIIKGERELPLRQKIQLTFQIWIPTLNLITEKLF